MQLRRRVPRRSPSGRVLSCRRSGCCSSNEENRYRGLVLLPVEGWRADRDVVRQRGRVRLEPAALGDQVVPGVVELQGEGIACLSTPLPLSWSDLPWPLARQLFRTIDETGHGRAIGRKTPAISYAAYFKGRGGGNRRSRRRPPSTRLASTRADVQHRGGTSLRRVANTFSDGAHDAMQRANTYVGEWSADSNVDQAVHNF